MTAGIIIGYFLLCLFCIYPIILIYHKFSKSDFLVRNIIGWLFLSIIPPINIIVMAFCLAELISNEK